LVAAVLIFLLFFSLFEYLATAEGKGKGTKGSDKSRVFRAGGVVVVVAVLLAGWPCCGEKGNGQSFRSFASD
jgi:lipid-binding SYLF domain-containing protein